MGKNLVILTFLSESVVDYRPQQSCGEVNVFTGICDSVHRGDVCLSACWNTTSPRSRHPPRADTPWSRQPPWSRHPPGADTPTPKSRHPRSRHPPKSGPPWEQTPLGADPPGSIHPLEQTPPRADTPLGADTPPGADTPWEQTLPREQIPPRSRHPLPDVRILLEYILVQFVFFFFN